MKYLISTSLIAFALLASPAMALDDHRGNEQVRHDDHKDQRHDRKDHKDHKDHKEHRRDNKEHRDDHHG